MRFSMSCHNESFQAGRGRPVKKQSTGMLQKSLFIIMCYFMSYSLVHAERYSVEKDSFGNYSAKKVEVISSPDKGKVLDEADKSATNNEAPLAPENSVKEDISEQVSVSKETAPIPSVANDDEPNAMENTRDNTQDTSSASSPVESEEEPEPRKLSIFEQKYLEAELAERERILKAIKSAEGVQSDYDATSVNPDEFIDSEELLRSADKQVKERSPYYVTIDEDGRPQTTFYDPTLVKEILFTERNKQLEFTEAQVYQEKDSEIAVPETADPVALAILKGGQDQFVSYFEKFSGNCCAQLPNIQTPEISLGKYHYFVLNEDSLPYRFSEGDSRFLLLRLPDMDQAVIPIRIRTFIRKFSEKNIEKGVFFPQIVTLNKDKEPLRIITGPLLKFQEETWTTHAYLQGIFAFSQTRDLDERYLLINTTRETLASSSSIELPTNKKGSARTVTIKHMNEGSFEIEILQ